MTDRALTPFETTLSFDLGKRFGAKIKQCYMNAFAMFQRDHLWLEYLGEERGRDSVYYVEGFFVSFAFPVEHAWVEIGDGENMIRIDPTLYPLRRLNKEEAPIYYPAFRYDWEQAAKNAIRSRRVPFWVDLEFTPEFLPMMQASERAWGAIDPKIAEFMKGVAQTIEQANARARATQ